MTDTYTTARDAADSIRGVGDCSKHRSGAAAVGALGRRRDQVHPKAALVLEVRGTPPAVGASSDANYAEAACGRPRKYPWTRSQPRARSASSCASDSTPTAMTSSRKP